MHAERMLASAATIVGSSPSLVGFTVSARRDAQLFRDNAAFGGTVSGPSSSSPVSPATAAPSTSGLGDPLTYRPYDIVFSPPTERFSPLDFAMRVLAPADRWLRAGLAAVSTAQHSTAQHSTAQRGTAERSAHSRQRALPCPSPRPGDRYDPPPPALPPPPPPHIVSPSAQRCVGVP